MLRDEVAIFAIEPNDSDEVRTALGAAERLWSSGAPNLAAEFVHQAAQAAFSNDADARGLCLARAAAELREMNPTRPRAVPPTGERHVVPSAASEPGGTHEQELESDRSSSKRLSVSMPARRSMRPAVASSFPSIRPARRTVVSTSEIDCGWSDNGDKVGESPLDGIQAAVRALSLHAPPLVDSEDGDATQVQVVEPTHHGGAPTRNAALGSSVSNARRSPVGTAGRPAAGRVDTLARRADTPRAGPVRTNTSRTAAKDPAVPISAIGEAVRVWVGPNGELEPFTVAWRRPKDYVDAILVSTSPLAGLAGRLGKRNA